MTTEVLIVIWVLCVFCGFLVGQSKNQVASGLIWTALFGIIGLIVVFCLPNRKKEVPNPTDELKALQEYQKYKQMTSMASQPSIPSLVPLRIAKGGNDMGEIDLPKVKLMLRNKELSLEDFYFDNEAQDWLPLETHPSI